MLDASALSTALPLVTCSTSFESAMIDLSFSHCSSPRSGDGRGSRQISDDSSGCRSKRWHDLQQSEPGSASPLESLSSLKSCFLPMCLYFCCCENLRIELTIAHQEGLTEEFRQIFARGLDRGVFEFVAGVQRRSREDFLTGSGDHRSFRPEQRVQHEGGQREDRQTRWRECPGEGL